MISRLPSEGVRKESVIAGMLCSYCVGLCVEEKTQALVRGLFNDVFAAAPSSSLVKVGKRPSVIVISPRSGSAAGGGGTSSGGLPSSPPPAAPAGNGPEIVVRSDWQKNEKVVLGRKRPCSECSEVVSEAEGHHYLFTSLGEKDKRFVCTKCIARIKAQIQGHATSRVAGQPAPRFSEVLETDVEQLLDDIFD